ncbi:MAG TPA: DEAD/DEAH box helicase, partial [Blastocatellia bacterium]|nr:DEAD/DEAH box helicase [Blastocatellia bacterium]
MAFDVFALRERVIGDYREYVESFVNILDRRVESFVREQLAAGELWPEAVLQLNPAFEEDATLGELAAQGRIARETARFFGEDLRLYRHQREALDLAQAGHSYVVTTGTGSGKSLTYLVPAYDAIVRDDPGRAGGVRALIVYPMNALINSQL